MRLCALIVDRIREVVGIVCGLVTVVIAAEDLCFLGVARGNRVAPGKITRKMGN